MRATHPSRPCPPTSPASSPGDRKPPRPNHREDAISSHARLERERRTVEALIRIYCRGRHGAHEALCAECLELRDYAHGRLAHCPFGASKPTCARCPVHCYRPEMRRRIRAVMRYAGPRMLLRRPRLALLHLVDGLRRLPAPTRGHRP